MKPKLRKVNSKKRKAAAKEANENLRKKTAQFLNHPTECCVCLRPFERTAETVKTWQVTVREDRVRLTCAPCWKIINEALSKLGAPKEEENV